MCIRLIVAKSVYKKVPSSSTHDTGSALRNLHLLPVFVERQNKYPQYIQTCFLSVNNWDKIDALEKRARYLSKTNILSTFVDVEVDYYERTPGNKKSRCNTRTLSIQKSKCNCLYKQDADIQLTQFFDRSIIGN